MKKNNEQMAMKINKKKNAGKKDQITSDIKKRKNIFVIAILPFFILREERAKGWLSG